MATSLMDTTGRREHAVADLLVLRFCDVDQNFRGGVVDVDARDMAPSFVTSILPSFDDTDCRICPCPWGLGYS